MLTGICAGLTDVVKKSLKVRLRVITILHVKKFIYTPLQILHVKKFI